MYGGMRSYGCGAGSFSLRSSCDYLDCSSTVGEQIKDGLLNAVKSMPFIFLGLLVLLSFGAVVIAVLALALAEITIYLEGADDDQK